MFVITITTMLLSIILAFLSSSFIGFTPAVLTISAIRAIINVATTIIEFLFGILLGIVSLAVFFVLAVLFLNLALNLRGQIPAEHRFLRPLEARIQRNMKTLRQAESKAAYRVAQLLREIDRWDSANDELMRQIREAEKDISRKVWNWKTLPERNPRSKTLGGTFFVHGRGRFDSRPIYVPEPSAWHAVRCWRGEEDPRLWRARQALSRTEGTLQDKDSIVAQLEKEHTKLFEARGEAAKKACAVHWEPAQPRPRKESALERARREADESNRSLWAKQQRQRSMQRHEQPPVRYFQEPLRWKGEKMHYCDECGDKRHYFLLQHKDDRAADRVPHCAPCPAAIARGDQFFAGLINSPEYFQTGEMRPLPAGYLASPPAAVHTSQVAVCSSSLMASHLANRSHSREPCFVVGARAVPPSRFFGGSSVGSSLALGPAVGAVAARPPVPGLLHAAANPPAPAAQGLAPYSLFASSVIGALSICGAAPPSSVPTITVTAPASALACLPTAPAVVSGTLAAPSSPFGLPSAVPSSVPSVFGAVPPPSSAPAVVVPSTPSNPGTLSIFGAASIFAAASAPSASAGTAPPPASARDLAPVAPVAPAAMMSGALPVSPAGSAAAAAMMSGALPVPPVGPAAAAPAPPNKVLTAPAAPGKKGQPPTLLSIVFPGQTAATTLAPSFPSAAAPAPPKQVLTAPAAPGKKGQPPTLLSIVFPGQTAATTPTPSFPTAAAPVPPKKVLTAPSAPGRKGQPPMLLSIVFPGQTAATTPAPSFPSAAGPPNTPPNKFAAPACDDKATAAVKNTREAHQEAGPSKRSKR